jgi:LPXTG-motif cell wall-anchored protein
MKKLLSLILVLSVLLGCVSAVSAADGNVTYTGNAGSIVFAPGSDYSPTDLFENFKGVMPGDSLEQKITVKNKASNNVKVKIYIRSLGANEGSEEFLSQLRLRVSKSGQNNMAYMFDASAEQSAQLTDWVYLGMLYSGGTVNLDVILDVPMTMGNEFQNQIGYLTWEFKIEEYPKEPTDPQPPQTGDDMQPALIGAIMGISAAAMIILLILYKRSKKED